MTKFSSFVMFVSVLVLAVLSSGCAWALRETIPHDGKYNRSAVKAPGYKYEKVCDQNNLGGEQTCNEETNVEPGAMYGGYGYGPVGGMVGPLGGGRPQAFNPPKMDCYVNNQTGQQCCVGIGQMCYGSEGDAFDPVNSPNFRLQRRVDAIGRQVKNLNRHEVAQDECIRRGGKNCGK